MEKEKKKIDKKNSIKSKKTLKVKNLSFEDSLKHIEKLANQLENGDLSLNETVSKYKEALSVLDHAGNLLNVVKKELQIVDSVDSKTISRKTFVKK